VSEASLLLRKAHYCLREGRIPEGITAFEELLALQPDLPDSWYNLGYLRRSARRFDEALDAYAKALALGIKRPEEVHLNRAVILSEHLERGEAAEEELKAALQVNPGFVQAWLNLGNLYEDRGNPTLAKAAYDQVIVLDRNNARALARLAAIDIFEGNAQLVPARLSGALTTSCLTKGDEAEICFALANAFDALGAYDEAFRLFQRANLASRASAPPPGIHYDAAAQEALIDRLIKAFPYCASRKAAGGIEPPVFICGMFRSGSTLAEQILARHSRVTPGGELEILPALVQARLQPYPDALASASSEMLTDLRSTYIANARAIFTSTDVLTDKRPDNFLHIGLIKALFPEARIVHTRRFPLDNILSVYFLHFEHSVSYGLDLGDIAHCYKQYLRLMRHWQALYPTDIYNFDYDEAVASPRPAIGGLLKFLGLEWEEACLASYAAGGAVRTASAWQVRQPIHSRSSGRWKNYERYLGEVRELLGDQLT
jgi:tetratricopeptide (TPR) repeat protein